MQFNHHKIFWQIWKWILWVKCLRTPTHTRELSNANTLKSESTKKFLKSTAINWNIKLKNRDYFMLLFSCMSQWIYFHVMVFNMKHMRIFSYFFPSSYSHMTYFFTHSLALIIHVTRRQFFLIVSQLISTLTIFCCSLLPLKCMFTFFQIACNQNKQIFISCCKLLYYQWKKWKRNTEFKWLKVNNLSTVWCW